MTILTQAEIDAALEWAKRMCAMNDAGYNLDADKLSAARVLIAFAAERRTPGTVEVCQRIHASNCAWGQPSGTCSFKYCPIRKPPTAAREGGT